jgi:two-component system, NarL family, sensor histidine kinase DevS
MRAPILPTARLFGAVAICLASAVLCTWLVLQPPSLGLVFKQTTSGATLRLENLDTTDPESGPESGDSLVAIAPPGGPEMSLELRDLLEEPDFLDTWAEEDAFYARQSAISAILHSSAVTLTLRDKANEMRTVTVTPRTRPLRSLPLIFWLQLLFGAAGLIIGAWVWALRPDDWGPRAYAVTGACFLIFAHAAAIYSARELALPGQLFRSLSIINHFGATHFGAALCALFLVYPLRLVGTRVLMALGASAFVWWLLGAMRVAPDQNWGTRFPVMIEMLGAVLIAVVQWRRTKGDPAARAVLRWFAVSVLTGCGAFIGLTAMVSAIGGLPPIPQGYAFGFFVLMYAGLAVGLRQYRLFDLDQWAYRILFWGLLVAAFVALDLALLGSANSGAARTLTIAMFLALGTFPLRRWVWSRLFDQDKLPPEQLFEKALHVTYALSETERDARWRALLKELFDPLHAAEDGTRGGEQDVNDVELKAQGQELAVPAVASSPALRLTYANSGKRLFTPSDARLVRTLISLMQSANEGRIAYDKGVNRERTRIARDLHDTVSSPLLAGLSPLHAGATGGEQLAAVQSEIRRAVQGMRSVVSGESVASAPLADCVADARYAAVERLTAAGVSVNWPLSDLDGVTLGPNERHALAAFVQESITNVIRHAGATHVDVDLVLTEGQLRCRIADDGRGFAPDRTRTGDGLPNLRARGDALSGTATIGPREDGRRGTEVVLIAEITKALSGNAR